MTTRHTNFSNHSCRYCASEDDTGSATSVGPMTMNENVYGSQVGVKMIPEDDVSQARTRLHDSELWGK